MSRANERERPQGGRESCRVGRHIHVWANTADATEWLEAFHWSFYQYILVRESAEQSIDSFKIIRFPSIYLWLPVIT